MNCPNCKGELANAGVDPSGGFCVQHFKCLFCQKEFVQETVGNIKSQLSELVEVREVEPDLIPESEENES